MKMHLKLSGCGHGGSVVHDLGLDVVPARVVEVIEEALHGGGGCSELHDPAELLIAVLALALLEPVLLASHAQGVLDARVKSLPGNRGGDLNYYCRKKETQLPAAQLNYVAPLGQNHYN